MLAANSITSLHAFHALVRINADTAAAELTPLMLARTDWPIIQPFAPSLLMAAAVLRTAHLPRTLRLLQADHAIGRLGEQANIKCLIPLLADAEWWVRYHSAQALVGMPLFGRAEATSLHDALTNRFARDMLAQAVA